MKTYQGSCHRGEVRFEVEADLDHVRVCDCSICSRRGALIHRVAKDRLRLLSPWENLSVYQYFFCPTAASCRFAGRATRRRRNRRQGLKPFDGRAVNVRCLDGVDYSAIPVRIYGSRI